MLRCFLGLFSPDHRRHSWTHPKPFPEHPQPAVAWGRVMSLEQRAAPKGEDLNWQTHLKEPAGAVLVSARIPRLPQFPLAGALGASWGPQWAPQLQPPPPPALQNPVPVPGPRYLCPVRSGAEGNSSPGLCSAAEPALDVN